MFRQVFLMPMWNDGEIRPSPDNDSMRSDESFVRVLTNLWSSQQIEMK